MSDSTPNNMIVLENIAETYYRAELSKEIHHSTSQKLIANMKFFGYANIILSAIIAAGIVTLAQTQSTSYPPKSMSVIIQMVIFFVSFFNTLIASLILYRNDGEAAHEHKITGDLYMEARDSIIAIYNQHLAEQCTQEKSISELQDIRKQLNLLARASRQTSKASYIKASKRHPNKIAILDSLKNGTFPIITYDRKKL